MKIQNSQISHTKPAAGIYESEGTIYLSLEMPGVEREEINLEIHEDTLKVSATKASGVVQEDYIVKERRPASYERTFALSKELATDQISARYEDGVLNLAIPRIPEVQPRRISIH